MLIGESHFRVCIARQSSVFARPSRPASRHMRWQSLRSEHGRPRQCAQARLGVLCTYHLARTNTGWLVTRTHLSFVASSPCLSQRARSRECVLRFVSPHSGHARSTQSSLITHTSTSQVLSPCSRTAEKCLKTNNFQTMFTRNFTEKHKTQRRLERRGEKQHTAKSVEVHVWFGRVSLFLGRVFQ